MIKNSQLEDFKNFIHHKKIAIVGLGRSNLPLMRFLLQFTKNIVGFDRKKEESAEIIFLKNRGVRFFLGEDYLDHLKGFDLIYRSPGFHPNHPAFVEEIRKGAVLSSEMEVFLQLCKGKLFGITGSDGKTTTTTLIYEMLKNEGYRCYLGGNIGNSLINKVLDIETTDMVVLELSSFQLLTLKKSPHVSVITNISPNHLDVHTSLEEYVDAKMNIYRKPCVNQLYKKRGVFNANTSYLKALLHGDKEEELIWFDADPSIKDVQTNDAIVTIREDPNEGVERPNPHIFYQSKKTIEKILSTQEILIPGHHNVENVMAAIGAVWDVVSIETIRKVARTFRGVRHRLEFIDRLDGVSIFNDSIATSPNRTIAGLRSFDQKVILIAGGADKRLSFDELAKEILDHVKALFLVGETANKIQYAFEKMKKQMKKGEEIPVYLGDDFQETVMKALEYANTGDVLLLSPASTSFDRFKDFEERGNVFKEIIQKSKGDFVKKS